MLKNSQKKPLNYRDLILLEDETNIKRIQPYQYLIDELDIDLQEDHKYIETIL